MADPLDILTPGEADSAMNVPSGTVAGDTERQQMVTAVSRLLDEMCGPVVQRTVTETHRQVRQVRPRNTPIVTVTSVTEWDGLSTDTTVLTQDTFGNAPNADGFWVDEPSTTPHGVVIRRTSAGADTWFTSGYVQLVYTAGRAADTASVDEVFKNAAAAILRRLAQRENGAWGKPIDPFDPSSPSGFFRAVEPMVRELIPVNELKPPAVV